MPITVMDRTAEGQELFNEAAFWLVSAQAPHELPAFTAIRDHYLSDPEQYLIREKKQATALEFGDPTLLHYLTVAALPLLSQILAWLATQVAPKLGEAATDELGKSLSKETVAWLYALFKPDTHVQPLFTQEDLQEIAKQIDSMSAREAKQLGLDPKNIALIRDFIISRLSRTQKQK